MGSNHFKSFRPVLPLPGYHYCGTGTPIPSSEIPINFWDACCKSHDLSYVNGVKSLEYEYDKILERCLESRKPQTLQESLEISFMLKALEVKHVTKSSCF